MGRARVARELLAADWGVEVCATCGATIVVGEVARRAWLNGREHTLCGACAAKPDQTLLTRRAYRSSSEAA